MRLFLYETVFFFVIVVTFFPPMFIHVGIVVTAIGIAAPAITRMKNVMWHGTGGIQTKYF